MGHGGGARRAAAGLLADRLDARMPSGRRPAFGRPLIGFGGSGFLAIRQVSTDGTIASHKHRRWPVAASDGGWDGGGGRGQISAAPPPAPILCVVLHQQKSRWRGCSRRSRTYRLGHASIQGDTDVYGAAVSPGRGRGPDGSGRAGVAGTNRITPCGRIDALDQRRVI
jgi:hypothetical protein